MILTEKEKLRKERDEKIVSHFKKLRAKETQASNNRIITEIATANNLDRNWVYRILKREKVI